MSRFYATTITLKVLSADPIPEDASLGQIFEETDMGAYVLDASTPLVRETLTREQMAEALLAAGSDPDFFEIYDEDGGEDA